MKLEKGLWQLYVGRGKGKTTAAFGLALRAVSQGLRVCVIQFMKASAPASGEMKAAQLLNGLDVFRFGGSFLDEDSSSRKEIKRDVDKGIKLAVEALSGQKYDLVILDEILTTSEKGLIKEKQILELALQRSPRVELVMTGRKASVDLIEAADLVTEMTEIKHPLKKGVKARRGIEY